MLKLLFWALLTLNGLLFAYGQGMLGSYKAGAREPQRVRNQLNTDRLVLQLPAGVSPAIVTAAPPTAPAPAAGPAAASAACAEVGNFNTAQARRFDRLLAPMAIGERQSRKEITVQEVTSHMVMIPPLGSKEAAERKAAELKAQGVTNYFIMNDTMPAKWGISLGVFKAETAAQTLLASLRKQGVTGAKSVGRTSQSTRQIYQFRDLDPAARAALESAVAKFDDIAIRACK